MQCPAIGSCLIEEFCGTYYQQGVPPCASKLVEAAPSASANSASDAIAILRQAIEGLTCGIVRDQLLIRLDAVSQQRTLP